VRRPSNTAAFRKTLNPSGNENVNPGSMTEVQFRTAVPSDAPAMVAVHYAAVHALEGLDYPDDVLEAWSPVPDEKRGTWLAGVVASADTRVWVAETVDGHVVGFGIVRLGARQLMALYVHPDWPRRGIGRALLHRLEEACLEAGLDHLVLNASYNAEAFYRAAGYQALGPTTQPVSETCSMGAIRMTKPLPAHAPTHPGCA